MELLAIIYRTVKTFIRSSGDYDCQRLRRNFSGEANFVAYDTLAGCPRRPAVIVTAITYFYEKMALTILCFVGDDIMTTDVY